MSRGDAAPAGGGLAEVLAVLAKATAGRWILATSCSWRRIVTEDSRPAIVPCVQQSDGHPDLNAGEDHVNAEAAIAAVNYLRSHGEAIGELIEAAQPFRRDPNPLGRSEHFTTSLAVTLGDVRRLDAALAKVASNGAEA